MNSPDHTSPSEHRAMRHEVRLRRRIMRAAAAGSAIGVKDALRQYLCSHNAKLAATFEARKRMPEHERPPKSKVPEIAGKIDPWKGTDEEVQLWWKPKLALGQFRPILSFGIENRALQILVLRALNACAQTHSQQFAGRGGTPAAISQVVEYLEAGYCHAVECDISNFFRSFDEEKVPDYLPLPKAVTNNVVIAKNLNIKSGKKKDNTLGGSSYLVIVPDHLGDGELEGHMGTSQFDTEAARRGIPQGASSSPLVAEVLLAPLIDALPGSGAVVNYGDNFLLLAKDANDVVAMSNILGKLLTKHPAGPLEPSYTFYQPGDVITFLGYAIHGHGSKLKVTPSQPNVEKFRDNFRSKVKWIKKAKMSKKRKRKLLQSLKNYVTNWTAAFPKWEGAEGHRKKYHAKVRALTKELGVNVSPALSKFFSLPH